MNEQLRRIMKYQILWEVNPISCMKTFRKLNCALCMRERVEILELINKKKPNSSTAKWKFLELVIIKKVSQVPQGEQDGEKYQY